VRTKSCCWAHFNASNTIRTVLDTVDSKTRIVLHFAGESDLERRDGCDDAMPVRALRSDRQRSAKVAVLHACAPCPRD
jgi:hypothetical protein